MALVDQLVEQYHALTGDTPPYPERATVAPARPAMSSRTPVSSPEPAATDAASGYAVRFLAFVYGIPFRLLAFQQELNDVFGYFGEWDEPFRERWERWDATERAAFRSALIEFRRLNLLNEQFKDCERRQEGRDLSHEERCAEMTAAYDTAASTWFEQFARQGSGIGPTSIPTAILGGDSEALASPAIALPPSADAGATQLTLELDVEPVSAPSPTPHEHVRLGATSGDFTFRLPGELSERNLSFSEISDAVLAALAEGEIADAEGRFLARVRWLLALTKQQRSAVVRRLLGMRRKQIAVAMGIAEESVKTHLQRADSQWAIRSTDLPRRPRPRGFAESEPAGRD